MNLNLIDSGTINASEAACNAPQNDVPVLRRAAMDYLARREHSSYELQLKLSRKFPDTPSNLLRQILLELQQEKLQSDDRFTEAYVRYRKSRGFGLLHIRAELLNRQVNESHINTHLQADDSDWLEITRQQAGKKLVHGERVVFGSKSHRKIVRFLQSRGFEPLDIRKTLEKYLASDSVR